MDCIDHGVQRVGYNTTLYNLIIFNVDFYSIWQIQVCVKDS